MRLSFKAALCFVFFGFISQAHAGLLVEPLIGYNINSKVEIDGGDSYSGGSGAAFGGRLGYQNLGFQLGLDYLHSDIDMDDADFKENITANEWAGFVGFEFPVLLRVYAGYIFSATGETEIAGNQKLEFSKGNGTKIGVGFTGLPFVDINVEYRTAAFGEYKAGGSTVKEDTKYSSLLLALSLPFNL